jgi:hypothetical protein
MRDAVGTECWDGSKAVMIAGALEVCVLIFATVGQQLVD